MAAAVPCRPLLSSLAVMVTGTALPDGTDESAPLLKVRKYDFRSAEGTTLTGEMFPSFVLLKLHWLRSYPGAAVRTAETKPSGIIIFTIGGVKMSVSAGMHPPLASAASEGLLQFARPTMTLLPFASFCQRSYQSQSFLVSSGVMLWPRPFVTL